MILFNKVNSGTPDVGSLGWKATGIVIVVIIIGIMIAAIFI
jgi:hypothetical protein